MRIEVARGIEKAKYICKERIQIGKEIKREGRKIIGYICLYAPLEIMTALQIIPFRMIGDISEFPTKVNRFLPQSFCPFVRSIFDLSLKKKYNFLDGIVWTHSCDAIERTGRIWESVIDFPYFHFLDIPTKIYQRHQKFFREGLNDFRKTLEKLVGEELSNEELKKAIQYHNEQRFLIRNLYENTKKTPPKILHSEILKVIGAITAIPVKDGNKLLREVISELKDRRCNNVKGPRLLIWGSIVDNPSFSEMIENLGGNVVIDDLCIGTKGYWKDVGLNGDLLESLAHYYLVELRCPRTFKDNIWIGKEKNYLKILKERYDYMREFINLWKVDGVILQSMKYCDCFGFEIPQIKDYFSNLGIPTLSIEHYYTYSDKESLKTRVEAFLEMLKEVLNKKNVS